MRLLIQNLFLRYQWSIIITYGLTLLENISELFYPFIIGITIDGLLQGKPASLLTLAVLWLMHTITEVARNIYDTGTFTQIYNHLVIDLVLEQVQQGIPTSQIVARSALSREFVDFFEQDVPRMITALFGLVGALIMLAFYDFQITCYCLLLLIPIVPLNIAYARKSLNLNHHLNNNLENEVDILTECQPEKVARHYTILANYRLKLSTANAINWGIMEILIIMLFMVILIRTISLSRIYPGGIYAIISYAWNYRQSLDIIPVLVQQLSRLQDISDRLQLNQKKV